MTPLLVAILLFALGLVLLVAELFMPGPGVFAVAGMMAVAAGVGASFFVDRWVGVGTLAAITIVGPLAAFLWFRAAPHAPVARGLVLPTSPAVPPAPPVYPG